MEQLKVFEIFFYDGSGVFYSGNIIQGYVTVELTEPMKMRGIKLNFVGKAYTRFVSKTSNATHSGTEKYFDQEVLLFGPGSGQGRGTRELQAGRQTFPFQFGLPQGLPSSYESKAGHVRYTVKSTIDRPWKFDQKTKRVFTIVSVLDLNMQPNTMSRLQETNQKYLCCICCTSGPIEATFHIDRMGYVPGEALKLYAEIINGVSKIMDKSFVDLKMTIYHDSYTGIVHSKTKTYEVARLTRPEIACHSKDNWTGEPLVVPPLPPCFLVGCNVIDIRYILQLNVITQGWGFELEIPLEIIIGTVPLRSVVEQNPPMPPLGLIRTNTYATETIAPGEMFYP
ncbi:unnamed protein product, partial [Lymnaea stagnalis]